MRLNATTCAIRGTENGDNGIMDNYRTMGCGGVSVFLQVARIRPHFTYFKAPPGEHKRDKAAQERRCWGTKRQKNNSGRTGSHSFGPKVIDFLDIVRRHKTGAMVLDIARTTTHY